MARRMESRSISITSPSRNDRLLTGPWPCVPGPDGLNVFTGIAGVCTRDLKRRFPQSRPFPPCMPTTHPKFFLSVPVDPGAPSISLGSKPFGGVSAVLHVVESPAPLLNLPDLELGPDSAAATGLESDFTVDKRVYYVVAAHMLLSIPFAIDRIIVQRFDLERELAESETDYFFVSSSPDLSFQSGVPYEYHVRAASRGPGVKFHLGSGPEGMQVSETGVVTWDVPADFSDETVDVVVNISNTANQASFDSFTLTRVK